MPLAAAQSDDRPSLRALHRARRMAYWNGGLWSIGNGLASTMLVVYLALELDTGVAGLGVSLILAAPHVVGALRLIAPALLDRLADRKQFCLGAFALSAAVLAALPWLASPGTLPTARASLAALVAIWCVYHLLQYLGTVAFWSWLADLVPVRIRGRFLGRRERWLVAGQAGAMLAAGAFTWGWHVLHPHQPRWIGYALPALLGVVFMLGALVPVALMPAMASRRRVPLLKALGTMFVPLTDFRFLRLVFFGCWFSFFNGITQSAHYVYPAQALGITLVAMLGLRTFMRVGQFALSPWMGRLADRWGNRPVMAASLLLVAQGPLFYFFASRDQPWWLAGAWAVWIAYAGLNVCLPNLMLRLSPERDNAGHIALYFAVTGLCYAASTVTGGVLADRWEAATFVLGGVWHVDYFGALFLFGWLMRALGVAVLLGIVREPDRADA
ncbi:MAG: hypothetical protein JW809_14620 [Pirellulales bacterium]|nr:hypothetical protein [Pirellulales bacterium]